jgi:uncharacterized protein YutE (UPF0331/DUF86 family)
VTFWQFVAEVVTGIAWPLALCWIVFILRREIRHLLPHARVRYGDLDISFRLDKAEEEAKNLPPASETEVPEIEEADQSDRDVAERSPEYAILESWAAIEEALQSVARNIVKYRGDAPDTAARRLLLKGWIDPVTAQMIEELRHVRNFLVHEPQSLRVSADNAVRFRELSRRILKALAQAELRFLRGEAAMTARKK